MIWLYTFLAVTISIAISPFLAWDSTHIIITNTLGLSLLTVFNFTISPLLVSYWLSKKIQIGIFNTDDQSMMYKYHKIYHASYKTLETLSPLWTVVCNIFPLKYIFFKLLGYKNNLFFKLNKRARLWGVPFISIGQKSSIGSNCYIKSHLKINDSQMCYANTEIGNSVELSPYTLVLAGAQIHDNSKLKTNSHIGAFTLINKNVCIEPFVTIMNNSVLGQNSRIGMYSYVGSKCLIADNMNIPTGTYIPNETKLNNITELNEHLEKEQIRLETKKNNLSLFLRTHCNSSL